MGVCSTSWWLIKRCRPLVGFGIDSGIEVAAADVVDEAKERRARDQSPGSESDSASSSMVSILIVALPRSW